MSKPISTDTSTDTKKLLGVMSAILMGISEKSPEFCVRRARKLLEAIDADALAEDEE